MPHAVADSIEATVGHALPLEQGQRERIFNNKSAGFLREKFDHRVETITNIRGHEDDYHLDTHGFAFSKAEPVPYEISSNREKFEEVVYPQIKEFVKKMSGATYVHIFSHIVRDNPMQAQFDIPEDLPDDATITLETPAIGAHIDQSYNGAEKSLEALSARNPELELELRSKTRWGIINVWKPLKPVTREPLAVCDARSVPDSDLQERFSRVNLPDGETIDLGVSFLQYGQGHKWYWPSSMQPDEALVLKLYDTKKDGRARRSPHCAIRTPQDHGPTRESVEIRCLVFWEGEEKE